MLVRREDDRVSSTGQPLARSLAAANQAAHSRVAALSALEEEGAGPPLRLPQGRMFRTCGRYARHSRPHNGLGLHLLLAIGHINDQATLPAGLQRLLPPRPYKAIAPPLHAPLNAPTATATAAAPAHTAPQRLPPTSAATPARASAAARAGSPTMARIAMLLMCQRSPWILHQLSAA